MTEWRREQARAPRPRSIAAQQLDAFTGCDFRGVAHQLDLFGSGMDESDNNGCPVDHDAPQPHSA